MQQANTKHRKSESNRQSRTRGRHTCADGVDVLFPNRTFRLPEQDEDNSSSTNDRMTLMNGIVYMIDKEKRLSGTWLFVLETVFDRGVSTAVKVAEGVKSVAFPSSVKNV